MTCTSKRKLLNHPKMFTIPSVTYYVCEARSKDHYTSTKVRYNHYQEGKRTRNDWQIYVINKKRDICWIVTTTTTKCNPEIL